MRLRSLLVLVLFAPVAGCGLVVGDNPAYCADSEGCTDPARPYCDINGLYGDGVRNRCVAFPFDSGISCERSEECTDDSNPICDLTAGQCRPCTTGQIGDAECDDKDSSKPLCGTDGTCFAGCLGSSECPDSDPICVDNVCGACSEGVDGDADCVEHSADTPRCASDGVCVGCIDNGDCAAAAPVCDADSRACRPCAEHDECESEVCDVSTGACVSESDIVYVAIGGADTPTCGTSDSPCASLMSSDGALSKLIGSKKTIKLRAGQYSEAVDINGNEVVLVGETGSKLSPPVSQNEPALRVQSGAKVTVHQLELANATGAAGNSSGADGIHCSSSTLSLWRVQLLDNQDLGLQASDCTLTVDRSRIMRNRSGGISVSDGPFTITNNFISENGGVSSIFGGVRITNASPASPQIFSFNTVARNLAGSGSSSAVSCTTSSPMTADHIIAWGPENDPSPISGGCAWAYSIIEGGHDGTNIADADPLFQDPQGSDYHIKSASPARNAGSASATLEYDIDGESRPQGNLPDIGADEAP